MIDGLVNILDNENLVYYIILFCSLYLVILWLIIPVWVYVDSKKKYNNNMISTSLFFLVLPLNIPGFLFYIIIRPDEHHHSILNPGDSSDEATVNVPIINFLSERNELVLGLDLKINKQVIRGNDDNDLHMDVSLNSNKGDIEIKVNEQKEEKTEKVVIDAKSEEKVGIFSRVKSKVNPSRFKNLIDKVMFVEEVVEEVKEDADGKGKTEDKENNKNESKDQSKEEDKKDKDNK